MPSYLVTDYRTSSFGPSLQNGTTTTKLGGVLHREVTTGDGVVLNAVHINGRSVQIEGNVFTIHQNRIYKFDSDAFYIPLGGFSGGFTFLEGGAWTSSGGASGTFLEDFVVGDTFMIALVDPGPTVGIGEVITVTVGGHTATTTAAQSQGGGAGQLGEYGVDHTLSPLVKNSGANTERSYGSLVALNINGLSGLSIVYKDTTNLWRGLSYDPDTSTWTQGTNTAVGSTSNEHPGKTSLLGNSIIFHTASASTGLMHTILYNPATDAISRIDKVVSATTGDALPQGYPIVEIQNRAFTLACVAGVLTIDLAELTGGVWDTSVPIRFTGANVPPFINMEGDLFNGALLLPFGEKSFFMFKFVTRIGPFQKGWFIAKFTLVDGGPPVCDNIDLTAPLTDTVISPMSNFILPAGLSFFSASLADNLPRWQHQLDQETNGPDGKPFYDLWHIGDPGGGTTDIYRWEVWDEIADGVVYTWPGGTADPSQIATSALSPTFSVGDWIGQRGDERMLEVTDVQPAYVEVANPQGTTLPTGVGVPLRLKPLSAIGINGGIAELAFPGETIGGGHRSFVSGELDVRITSISPLPGAQRIGFKAYGGGTVNVRFFYGPDKNRPATSLATITDASVGVIAANVNTGITADGSENFVTWQSGTDGVSTSESRVLTPDVFP